MKKRYRPRLLYGLSLICFVAAAICMRVTPQTGVTAEVTLLQSSGKVAWVQEYKYGTRFGLAGIHELFDYPSKSKGMGTVREALTHSGDKVISVRYESKTHGPIYSDDKYHTVWELAAGDRMIRSYAMSASAWADDNRVAPWIGAAMILCGLILGYAAWRLPSNSSRISDSDSI